MSISSTMAKHENLQDSIRAESADNSIEKLSEALSAIREAY